MFCVCHTFASVHVALLSLVGKGLTTWLLFAVLNIVCHFPIWYPGSGVVPDCIDSR